MFKILITDPISDKCLVVFDPPELFQLHKNIGLSEEELIHAIQDVDVILVRSKTKVTKAVIEAGKKLKIIARAGIGLDNIDLEAATAAGITVINSSESTISVAEHTIGMILALARNIPQAHASVIGKLWEKEKYQGVEVYNKTLGIIGVGKIGSQVAIRAQALGMHLIAYDPYCSQEKADQLSIDLVPFAYLLQESDFITIHTPRNDETIDLISYIELAVCKKTARVINLSRGGIVNEKALIYALTNGLIAGAALDAFDNEPNIDLELIECPGLIFTPHIGGSTLDAQEKIAVTLALKIVDLLHEMKPLEIGSAQSSYSPEVYEKQSG